MNSGAIIVFWITADNFDEQPIADISSQVYTVPSGGFCALNLRVTPTTLPRLSRHVYDVNPIGAVRRATLEPSQNCTSMLIGWHSPTM